MMHKKGTSFFTSESVAEGHPDKMCDQISDAILDACLTQDKMSRVACNCTAKGNNVYIVGEITTNAKVDYANIARGVIRRIGYTKDCGFDDSCKIDVNIVKQSSDISQGVSGTGLYKEQGAGDQGMMFGYAINETPELMPFPLVMANKLLINLANLRRSKKLPYLRPDGKSQVTAEYKDGKIMRIDTIIISTQHSDKVDHEQIQKDLIEYLIKPTCEKWVDKNTKYYVNPTGKFIIGGPVGDSGLTGRKIIVDTYGSYAHHGGGAFSGKDPTKVDRSAAYMCRYIAKNIVAAKLADEFEIQVAYAIGVAKPVSIYIDSFGTNKIPEDKIRKLIEKHFLLKPAEIIDSLNLRRPIYEKTASYGHFGRSEPEFTWELTDKASILAKEAKATKK
jgi:S-adenosylmethionine synthetase